MKKNTPPWKNLSLKLLKKRKDGIVYIEKWEAIKDYEGMYEISNFGRVKSLAREVMREYKDRKSNYIFIPEKILRQNNLQTGGYCAVNLCKDGNHVSMKIHRLVAIAFIPNPENKPEVNHKRGVKTDNHRTELEWSTKSENITHSFNNGFHTVGIFGEFGSKNPKSKPVSQFSKDGTFINTFSSQREAFRMTGVDQSMIWHCCNGRLKSGGSYLWQYAKGYSLGERGASRGHINYSQKTN